MSEARLVRIALRCCSEYESFGSFQASPHDTYTNWSLPRPDKVLNSLPSSLNMRRAANGNDNASVHLSRNCQKQTNKQTEIMKLFINNFAAKRKYRLTVTTKYSNDHFWEDLSVRNHFTVTRMRLTAVFEKEKDKHSYQFLFFSWFLVLFFRWIFKGWTGKCLRTETEFHTVLQWK